MSFSEILSNLRKEKGLSQRQVASDLGVSQALLSHYENGAREPKLEFVIKACDYYEVTADFILGRSIKETGDILISQECFSGLLGESKDLKTSSDAIYEKLLSVLSGLLGEFKDLKTSSDAIYEKLLSALRESD